MADLSGYDEEQVKLMAERVILVDENDKVIGHESKKNSIASLLMFAPPFHCELELRFFSRQLSLIFRSFDGEHQKRDAPSCF